MRGEHVRWKIACYGERSAIRQELPGLLRFDAPGVEEQIAIV